MKQSSLSDNRYFLALLIAILIHLGLALSTHFFNEIAQPTIEEELDIIELEMFELLPEPEEPPPEEPPPEEPPPEEPPPEEPPPEEPPPEEPPPEEPPPVEPPPEELPVEEDVPSEDIAPADVIVEQVTQVVTSQPPQAIVKPKPKPKPFVMPQNAPSRFWTSKGITNQSGRLKDSEEKPYGCAKAPNVPKGGGIRLRGLEPLVRMKVAINANGDVQSYKVIKHKDDWNNEFMTEVQSIILSCRFEPKLKDGKRVATWLVREEQFEITPFR